MNVNTYIHNISVQIAQFITKIGQISFKNKLRNETVAKQFATNEASLQAKNTNLSAVKTSAFLSTKQAIHYMVLRALVGTLLIILFVMAISLVFLPQKASADVTYTIPVAGLGYYVDANGRPITTGQTQYTCTNGTCTPVQANTTNAGFTLTSSPNNNGANTGNTTNASNTSSGAYPHYTTPVQSTLSNYTQLPQFPFPRYTTPAADYSMNGVSSDGNLYLAYPTYGSTPIYGKISTKPYVLGTGIVAGENGTTGTNTGNNGTTAIGGNTSNGNRGFVMTSYGY
jgi:hypothetical protein